MKCPQCHKEILQNSARCVCGYSVETETMAENCLSPGEAGILTIVEEELLSEKKSLDTIDSAQIELPPEKSQCATIADSEISSNSSQNITISDNFSPEDFEDVSCSETSKIPAVNQDNSFTMEDIDASALTFDESADNKTAFDGNSNKDITIQNLAQQTQKEKQYFGVQSQAVTYQKKPPQKAFEPGSVIKNTYKILKVLGQGGMGKVYLANHLRLNKTVVIKTLLSHSGSETSLKRFEREALLQAQVNHPNAVSIIDMDQTEEGILYMVMDYAPGKPLSELIQSNAIDFHDVIEIGKQILEVLIYAHEKKIIHRDLKPQNIIVDGEKSKYHCKILDFGIAKMLSENQQEVSDNLTGENRIVGTLRYMPPEQAIGEKVDFTADLYSVGVVLYEMTTGSVPFVSNESFSLTSMLINKKPPSFHEIKPRFSVSKSLENAIMKALSKNPSERFRSAEEFKKELERIAQDGSKPSFSYKKVYAAGFLALAFLLSFASTFLYKNYLEKKEIVRKEQEKQEKAKIELIKKEKEKQENYKKIQQEIQFFKEKEDWEAAFKSIKKAMEIADAKEQESLLNDRKDLEKKIAQKILTNAKKFQDMQLLEKALSEYQRVLEYDKNLAEAHYYSGEIFYWQAKYDKASEFFFNTIQLQPDFALAYNKLGDIAIRQNDMEKSFAYFQKALEIQPLLAESHSGLGVIYSHQEDYKKALEHLQKAQEIAPDLIEAKQNLAIVFQKLEKYKEALEVYEKWKELEPDNPDIPYNMGSMYLKTKDYDNALKNFESFLLLEKSPQERERVEKIQRIVRQLKARGKKK